MLTVFFDVLGVVMAEWVPSGQTVSQHYYAEILTKLNEWEENGWILHQDKVPSHNALSV